MFDAIPELVLKIEGHQIVISSLQWFWVAVTVYTIVGWFGFVRKFLNNELPATSENDLPVVAFVTCLYLMFWLPVIVTMYVGWPILKGIFKVIKPVFLTKENRR